MLNNYFLLLFLSSPLHKSEFRPNPYLSFLHPLSLSPRSAPLPPQIPNSPSLPQISSPLTLTWLWASPIDSSPWAPPRSAPPPPPPLFPSVAPPCCFGFIALGPDSIEPPFAHLSPWVGVSCCSLRPIRILNRKKWSFFSLVFVGQNPPFFFPRKFWLGLQIFFYFGFLAIVVVVVIIIIIIIIIVIFMLFFTFSMVIWRCRRRGLWFEVFIVQVTDARVLPISSIAVILKAWAPLRRRSRRSRWRTTPTS